MHPSGTSLRICRCSPLNKDERIKTKDEQLKTKDETISLLKDQAQFNAQKYATELAEKDKTIATLQAQLGQIQSTASQDGETAVPVRMVDFNDDMELDTVTVSGNHIKFGKWLIQWVEAKSLAENCMVTPDHYMFRLWLGVSSPAVQNRLKPSDFENMFWHLRKAGFGDRNSLPSAHKSIEELRTMLSRFTGF